MGEQLWTSWLDGLPCQEDETEGLRTHGILLQLVQKQKPELLGPSGAHLPRILSILLDVYKTEMADDITSWGIGRLLSEVGETQLQVYSASFTAKQQKKLARVLREAKSSTA